MDITCSQNGRNRSGFNILTGTSTGKRPSGSPRRRWEGNIRLELEEIGINMRN